MSQIISVEYPYTPAHPDASGVVAAVLVKDGCGKYRAYIGIVPYPASRSEDNAQSDLHWVASRGRKLRFEEAVPKYFVGFTAREYAE